VKLSSEGTAFGLQQLVADLHNQVMGMRRRSEMAGKDQTRSARTLLDTTLKNSNIVFGAQ